MTGLRPLRPPQAELIGNLRSALAAGYPSVMAQLPTGGGKTVIAAHIVDGLLRRGKRVCFSVPTIDLVDQTMDRFAENGIDRLDMGAMQGNHPWSRPGAPIQIATGQTLALRALPDVDAVIIDEAHRRFRVYDRWIASTLGRQISSLARETEAAAAHLAQPWSPASGKLPRPFFIGLSATPWAKGLGQLFDVMVKGPSTQHLIDEGYLSPFVVYAPSHPDLTGVRTTAGDYNEGDLAERMNKDALVADIVSTWLRLGDNRPTLCFCTGRDHARAVHDRFTAAGVSAAYVDANTPRDERAEIGRALAAGTVKVVCNIGCLTTGIDWDVRCLILARPTKSEMLFVQIIGRALRTAPGKDRATILDHSDTHLRLGMVTDIDHDELDDGRTDPAAKRKAAEERGLPLPKECLECAGLIPAGSTNCPCCGAAVPRRAFVEVEGELAEFQSGGRRPSNGKGPKVADVVAAMGKESVYRQLRYHAHERGRSDGWVAHTYREVFGVWPRGMPADEYEQPLPVMRSWLRSRDIAYAKSAKARQSVEVSHA